MADYYDDIKNCLNTISALEKALEKAETEEEEKKIIQELDRVKSDLSMFKRISHSS